MFPSEKDFVYGDPQIEDGLKTQHPNEAVCALIFRNRKIIAVSRKDNHSDFGLIGGKVDKGETPVEALLRETFEETGLKITGYEKIFERRDGNFICYTYLCVADGEITTDNEISEAKGVVKEVTWEELFAGSFGEYNRQLYKSLVDNVTDAALNFK